MYSCTSPYCEVLAYVDTEAILSKLLLCNCYESESTTRISTAKRLCKELKLVCTVHGFTYMRVCVCVCLDEFVFACVWCACMFVCMCVCDCVFTCV